MSSYTIPSVIQSTPKGERISDVFSRLLAERIVFIGTPIDDGVANVVIAQLLHLAAESDTDMHLYLNSAGGSWRAFVPRASCPLVWISMRDCTSSATWLSSASIDRHSGTRPKISRLMR